MAGIGCEVDGRHLRRMGVVPLLAIPSEGGAHRTASFSSDPAARGRCMPAANSLPCR